MSEPEPKLDASRPSSLRLAGFLTTAIGALLIGVGSTLTWVTVGLRDQPIVDTATRGVDLTEGIVALVCAAVMLVAIVASRMTKTAFGRTVWACLVVGGSVIATALGASFLVSVSPRFDALDSDVVAALATATGRSPAQIVATFGAFTDVGPGPLLVLAGGLIGILGGILILVWGRRAGSGTEVLDPPTED